MSIYFTLLLSDSPCQPHLHHSLPPAVQLIIGRGRAVVTVGQGGICENPGHSVGFLLGLLSSLVTVGDQEQQPHSDKAMCLFGLL